MGIGRTLPLSAPRPDGSEFIDILLGRAKPARIPLVEYLVDDVVMRPIVSDLLGRTWVDYGRDRESQIAYLENFIRFWYALGYDVVRYEQSLLFPEHKLLAADTAPSSHKQREWADERRGAITTWEDFERYPWPVVKEFDFFPFEYLSKHLPEGMGLILCHGGGVFEHLSWIMSIEGLCTALLEDPELVRAVAKRLGELMSEFYTHLLDLENLVAIFPGDDMGFRTGTMVSPEHLREYVLPWHARFAAMAHKHGVPYFLHSCGNIDAIMDDLIARVGIDGKHSFEDAIIPVQDFQARYGQRIAVLGGLDLNILSGGSSDDVRKHTRELMEICGSRGRYAIGSGNSVPSYVPVENYLAMVSSALP